MCLNLRLLRFKTLSPECNEQQLLSVIVITTPKSTRLSAGQHVHRNSLMCVVMTHTYFLSQSEPPSDAAETGSYKAGYGGMASKPLQMWCLFAI